MGDTITRLMEEVDDIYDLLEGFDQGNLFAGIEES